MTANAVDYATKLNKTEGSTNNITHGFDSKSVVEQHPFLVAKKHVFVRMSGFAHPDANMSEKSKR